MLTNLRTTLARRFTSSVATQAEHSEQDSAAVRRSIKMACKTRGHLEQFIQENKQANRFISLGQNCSTAWYLKQVGVKLDSYPFDWIFTSCGIIEDCIKNRFSFYKDPSQFYRNKDGSAGHHRYHSRMFNHRSPLDSESSLTYYQRCCERFLEVIDSDTPCVFVITLLNESEKRPDWASGFTESFPLPTNQTVESATSLMELITSRNRNSRFLIIEQYTLADWNIKYERVNEDVFHIVYGASEASSGTSYIGELDDFCFRLVMSALT